MEPWKDGYEGGVRRGRNVLCANINNSSQEGKETLRVKVRRNLMIGSFRPASIDFQTHHLGLVTQPRSYQLSSSLRRFDLSLYDGNRIDCITNLKKLFPPPFFVSGALQKFQHGRSSVQRFSSDKTIWRRDRNRQYIGLLWYPSTPVCTCKPIYIDIYWYIYDLFSAPERVNYDPRGNKTKKRAGPECLVKHYVKTLTRKWNVQHQSAYEDRDQTSLHTPASGSVWTASLFSPFSFSFLVLFFSPFPILLQFSLFSPLCSSAKRLCHDIPVGLLASLAHFFHDGGTDPCFH